MSIRDDLAKVAYEAQEEARAKEEDGPRGVWTPWLAQTSRRERRIAYVVADAILTELARNGIRIVTVGDDPR